MYKINLNIFLAIAALVIVTGLATLFDINDRVKDLVQMIHDVLIGMIIAIALFCSKEDGKQDKDISSS